MSMKGYTPTIGLEIHAELKTRTKMFCNSKNDSNEEEPNVNICPVCMAHPGTLPVINKNAVHHVLKVGTAVGGTLADYTEFDRKNYFYPDIPKGYQISQYEYPLVEGGELEGVKITRIHLEEDTARSLHDEKTDTTLIDFNRAGVPLMELVTEPVIESAETAGKFARELQTLLRRLGVSDANMEKGEMRVEANVSVSSNAALGTKVEIKNLNSFRAMERAVAFEIKRQIKLIEEGKEVVQETRGWDEATQQTFAQRKKEGAADYRYFPDPDLPKLHLSEIQGCTSEDVSLQLPELPWQQRGRYMALGIKPEDTEMYIQNQALGAFFDSVTDLLGDTKKILLASNYIATDLIKIIRDSNKRDTENIAEIAEIPVAAEDFATLIRMLSDGQISSRAGKDILLSMATTGKSPIEIAESGGLFQTSDEGELGSVVDRILSENETVALDFKSGKESALQFLIGQGMKMTKGSANPETLRSLLLNKLQ